MDDATSKDTYGQTKRGGDMNINDTYQRLIPLAIKQNKQTNSEIESDKVYRDTNIPFIDDRILNIRWIKIPLFMYENHRYSYGIFINDIDHWRKGEIKQIKQQTMESMDTYDIDSYTIFQFGKFHGTFEFNENMKFHKIFILNSKNYEQKHENLIYQQIIKFIQKRINKISMNPIRFNDLDNDLKRLNHCITIINNITLLSSNIRSDILKESSKTTSNLKVK